MVTWKLGFTSSTVPTSAPRHGVPRIVGTGYAVVRLRKSRVRSPDTAYRWHAVRPDR